MWEAHGDSMRLSLARHDEIVRDAVEGVGGVVVKTTGDGALAAFASGLDGIRATSDAQRKLGAEAWPEDTRIRIRMALHTGVAEERDGDISVRRSIGLRGLWRLATAARCSLHRRLRPWWETA